MALNVYSEKGIPIDQQWESFQKITEKPIDAGATDAYTKTRIAWMWGTENEQWNFYHNFSRCTDNEEIKQAIAQIRRTEDQQRSRIGFFFDPRASVLENTITIEQLAVDLTAAMAKDEPDPYIKQALDFGLLEDFDHLFRYSVLMSRLEGKDANKIVEGRTDIKPGRPTAQEHLHPLDTVRKPPSRTATDPLSVVHVMSITAPEQQTREYYNSHGYLFKEEEARQLYAEIGEIEEQHVTHYESLLDPNFSLLEMAFLHEYNEVYDYYCCLQMETDPRFKPVWEHHLQEELGHVRVMGSLLQKYEGKSPEQLMPSQLPKLLVIQPAKEYVNQVLATQVDLRASGKQFVPKDQLPRDWPSYRYLETIGASSAPSTRFERMEQGGMQGGASRGA